LLLVGLFASGAPFLAWVALCPLRLENLEKVDVDRAGSSRGAAASRRLHARS